MPGAWTTKTIKDGAGANLTVRMWDESGAGTGPFSFGQTLSDGGGVNAPPGFAAVPTTAQAMSAGYQLIGLPTDAPTQAVAPDTSRILNGASGVSLTPKWAFVDATTSGDTSVVALVAAKKIRVLFWEMSPNAAVNARFRSNTTSKTALYYMAGQGNGQRAGFNQAGWFETAAGEALNINLSGSVNVGVLVGYIEV